MRDVEKERAQLIRDKYHGDESADVTKDMERLAAGEPLAYVIGWQPFHGLHINLASPTSPSVCALIPRPETEWWTEQLIDHLNETSKSSHVLDLCAGSGAVGCAVLSRTSSTRVSFGELVPELAELIHANIRENNLDESRADVQTGNLFEPFAGERFDIIAVNPPYIPYGRKLPASVTNFEPHEALFGGDDGLDVIRGIFTEAKNHLHPKGELWMECDVSNIPELEKLARGGGATTCTIHEDLYGRPRLLVAHFE